MHPVIQFHWIARVELTPITHYKEEPDRPEFWCRNLVLTDAAGTRFSVPLFSNVEGGLELPRPIPVIDVAAGNHGNPGGPPLVAPDGSKSIGVQCCEETFTTAAEAEVHESVHWCSIKGWSKVPPDTCADLADDFSHGRHGRKG